VVDDDRDGSHPPPGREPLARSLASHGLMLDEQAPPVIALFSDVRAGKARPGLSLRAREEVGDLLRAAPAATVVLFGHPRLADELPEARNLLVAWGGEALMQEAVAARLAGLAEGIASPAAGLPG